MNKTSLSISRRKFLSMTGCSALALPLRGQGITGANERVRIGIIGCGIRGTSHGEAFPPLKNVEIVALCDPDTAQMDALVETVKKRSDGKIDLSRVKKHVDYRKVFERKDVDAVVICSPNSWHTLHAIQAMEAGKDVYVEKPVSHSIWEGKQLLAARDKYGVIVAAGFQNRSDPGPQDGIRYLQEGNLGKILSAHACCFKNRQSIGRQDKPLVPPSTCDYNLWLGPREDQPMFRPRFHYDWHWIWNTGDGDIGNQCPHEIDLMCWALGDQGLPTTMKSFGNRFAWDDAGETPNMHTAWFELNGIPCVIEVNNVQLTPERNVAGIRDGVRIGMVIRCEGGQLRGGRGGTVVVAEDGRTVLHKFPGDSGKSHQQNFIDAVRARSTSGLQSKIEVAEVSSAIAHLTNVSIRSGQEVPEKRLVSQVNDDGMLNTIVSEQSAQLRDWGISDPSYTLGRELRINPKSGQVTTAGVEHLVRLNYRKGFTVPELV